MIQKNMHDLFNNKVSHLHNGAHACFGGRLFDQSELGNESWRFIDVWKVPPGSEIGLHIHHYGRELYFVLEGSGTMTTNGESVEVKQGDFILNEPGDTHRLINHSNGDVYLLVTMVMEEQGVPLSKDVP